MGFGMVELITLEGVAKYYEMGDNVVRASDNIDMKIEQGDFVAIMGPSGSGKSTAMNLVGSLDVPTKGEIRLKDRNVSYLSESELAQLRGKKIGFIFQSFNLIPNLTAKENVMLPMLFQNISREERENKAIEILKLVELEDRMEHYPNQLSGGQQQRVAIARALVNNPSILFADEPTANLDTESSEVILNLFKKLNKENGQTIIMVTHEPDDKKWVDRVIWLKDGVIEK